VKTRWIGRILRDVRAGEPRSTSKHSALLGVPGVISLKSEWFLNGKTNAASLRGNRGMRECFSSSKLECVPTGTVELTVIVEPMPPYYCNLCI
jgi:hypothetical protein